MEENYVKSNTIKDVILKINSFFQEAEILQRTFSHCFLMAVS